MILLVEVGVKAGMGLEGPVRLASMLLPLSIGVGLGLILDNLCTIFGGT